MYKNYENSEDEWEEDGSNDENTNDNGYENRAVSTLPRTIFENINRDQSISKDYFELTIDHPDYFTGQ